MPPPHFAALQWVLQEAQLDFLCSNKLQYPFDEVAAGVVRASVAVQQSKFLDAYASHLHALTYAPAPHANQ